MTKEQYDVTIVGGGITGLAAAWKLKQEQPSLRVAIVEQQSRVGGRIDHAKVGPFDTELGADCAIARESIITELFSDLELTDEVQTQNIEHAMLYVDNEFKYLPRKTAFGLPVSAKELKAGKYVSSAGLRRYKQAVKQTFTPTISDMSLGAFVRERLGEEVAEHIVDPLLGSIHAGSIDSLSLQATAPQLAEVARKGGSVHDVLEPLAQSPKTPMFLSLRHGMGQLASRFQERLSLDDTDFVSGNAVARIELARNTPQVILTNRQRLQAKNVILATPSYTTSRLIAGLDPQAGELLDGIAHASVAMCVLVYRRDQVDNLPSASGFLVGHDSLLLTTACSFASEKWDRYNDGEHVVFRVSAGRADDVRALATEDKELVRHLHAELANILQIQGVPAAAVLRRWPRAFPQYAVGHLQKIDAIETALSELSDGLHIAGASYRGVGIPSCVRQGYRAADRTLANS